MTGMAEARAELNQIQQRLSQARHDTISPHPDVPNAPLAHTHRCRACHANAGESCTNRGTGQPLLGFHHSRLADAGLVEPEKPFDQEAFARAVATSKSEPPAHSDQYAKSCTVCGECCCAMTEASQASCPLHGIGSEHTA